MPKYRFSQLSQPTGSIRLLRLLPSERDPQNLRCEVFEYDLQNSPLPYHHYEAISYVWGGENKPCSILLGDQSLSITQNLHAILLRLRAYDWSRVIWADAVCINQEDEREQEKQIPLIAEIYAKAQSVIVWLGEAEADEEQALRAICLAGNRSAKHLSHAKSCQPQIIALLRRPWFQRIWVLQEVAAARHISIMCGSAEIDGHAFSLGLESLDIALERPITQVALIRESIFRPRNIPADGGRLSLDICSLGELIDMYHTHRATRLHDKVYALFGMCSEDVTASDLKPNYNLEWKELMCQLVKFILGGQISVKTWNDKQMAIIESKGVILGTVSQVHSGVELGGKQSVKVVLGLIKKGYSDRNTGRTDQWILTKSAIPIQPGDIICLLQGAPRPSIVRFYNNHFMIIMIAALPSEGSGKVDGVAQWPKLSRPRELSLLWNWEFSSEEVQSQEAFSSLLYESHWKMSEIELVGKIKRLITIWDFAQILEDVRDHHNAQTMFREAVKSYGTVFGYEPPHIPETQHVMTLLSWAAWNGHEAVVKMLLATGKADVNLKDKFGLTPLYSAAMNGHEAIVKLLLATGKADVDLKDKFGRMSLYWAAMNGHEAIIKLLLATGKVDVGLKDKFGETLLYSAARNGHEAIVKLLLATGKVNVDSKDEYGQTPLYRAARNGHESVVKMLLATGKVNVDSKDEYGQTPLYRAVRNGHESVVKMLLATGKADVNLKDKFGLTPLYWAAENGHEAVVKLLRT